GGNNEQAFLISERLKARTLVDLMGKGKVDVNKSITAEERQQEAVLTGLITRLSREAPEGAELQEARVRYDDFHRDLYFKHPELRVQSAAFAPASLTEIKQEIFAGDVNSAVLSYVSSPGATWLMVLTSGEK